KLWIPPSNLEEEPNQLMNWETVNPQWWVPKGYAAVRVDGRGSGKSPGQCEPWSLAESIDFYDAIEWAAAQPSISPSTHGSSPITSRRRCRRSFRGKVLPTLRCAVPRRIAQPVHAQLVPGASHASSE